MKLVEYGIQTEKSDIRAHVSFANKAIYVFRTECGLEAVRSLGIETRNAYQPGSNVRTATGWPVPFDAIEDLRVVKFDWRYWDHYRFDWPTPRKGRWAVACVQESLRRGVFPVWSAGREEGDMGGQIAGTDLIVGPLKIQVKCDARCGPKPRGTGNLFLQKAERNPFCLN